MVFIFPGCKTWEHGNVTLQTREMVLTTQSVNNEKCFQRHIKDKDVIIVHNKDIPKAEAE